MTLLLLITMLSQPASDGRETLSDVSFSSVITIMPDMRVKHVITMRIRKGEFAPRDEIAVVKDITDSIVDIREESRDTIAALPMKTTVEGCYSSYQWYVYCDDIHSYGWLREKGEKVSFQASADGCQLVMSQSAEKSLLPPPAALSSKEVIIMPGIVRESSDCHLAVGRTATTEWTRVDALDRASSDKVRIARKSPRRIDCGPNTLTRSEIELFEKEFTSAMARAKEK
jgi:hypothetical protein